MVQEISLEQAYEWAELDPKVFSPKLDGLLKRVVSLCYKASLTEPEIKLELKGFGDAFKNLPPQQSRSHMEQEISLEQLYEWAGLDPKVFSPKLDGLLKRVVSLCYKASFTELEIKLELKDFGDAVKNRQWSEFFK
jgi:hypothetical protein